MKKKTPHISSLSAILIFTLICIMITSLFMTRPVKLLAEEQTENSNAQTDLSEKNSNTLDMLISTGKLIKSFQEQIAEKKRLLKKNTLTTDLENTQEELKMLDQQLKDAENDFESIATGIDIKLFEDKTNQDTFNWQNELLSILEPGIKELKRLTLRARQKTKLKEEVLHYDNLLPIADQAADNLQNLITTSSDSHLLKILKPLQAEWVGLKEQMETKRNMTQMQLEKMEKDEISLIESSGTAIKKFVKTRGFYITIALTVCLLVIISLRILHFLLLKVIPGRKLEFRPPYIRVIDLIFRMSMVVFSSLALILVFYYTEDWGLLSLTIIFLLGLIWALKQSIPKLWKESCLMLNIGAVRESERILYHGIPWLVRDINIYCKLENPALNMTIRLPIEELIGRVSRPVKKGEPWFPCHKNDWVILSDGIRGKVTSLSHEMVELVQRGGARKTYQTRDFLGLSPLNLSRNFRLKVMFGIGYSHQKQATNQVLDLLTLHITDCIENEGYKPHLLNLRVEFCQAGASSLDLLVITDFDGEMAPLYNRLHRAIQRWCVDACSSNGWEIPFPQLTIHKG